jgi:hypothetical protein
MTIPTRYKQNLWEPENMQKVATERIEASHTQKQAKPI